MSVTTGGVARRAGRAPGAGRPPATTDPLPTSPAGRHPPPPQVGEARRDLRRFHAEDIAAVLGSLAASASVVWIVYTKLLPLTGKLGFALSWFAVFLGLYAVLVWSREDRLEATDRVLGALWTATGCLAIGVLTSVVGFVAVRGSSAISHRNFFTQSLSAAGPLEPLSVGGILHGIVGTLIMIAIAVVVTVPLGLATAVFLVEVGGPLARVVGMVVDAMTALPSIVAGLFIYATWILILRFPDSGLAAALALSVMMLPIITRAAAVVLRLVPGSLREASYALGSSQWRTVWSVVLPTARPGLATAVILGMARGIGETSPVLLTAGYTLNFNADPTAGPMVSLPLLTYELVRSGQPAYVERAYGAALTLLVLVFVLFLAARLIGRRRPGS